MIHNPPQCNMYLFARCTTAILHFRLVLLVILPWTGLPVCCNETYTWDHALTSSKASVYDQYGSLLPKTHLVLQHTILSHAAGTTWPVQRPVRRAVAAGGWHVKHKIHNVYKPPIPGSGTPAHLWNTLGMYNTHLSTANTKFPSNAPSVLHDHMIPVSRSCARIASSYEPAADEIASLLQTERPLPQIHHNSTVLASSNWEGFANERHAGMFRYVFECQHGCLVHDFSALGMRLTLQRNQNSDTQRSY
jgi:hypothetical protein